MERGEHSCEHLKGRMECMSFTRASVQTIGDRIEISLAVYRQVRALGQVLAPQAVGAFTGAALPRAVRVEK